VPQLPVVRPEAAIQAFERAGFVLHHWQGSHAILYHRDGRHLSIPVHRREMPRGTLRALIRLAGLTVEAFAELLS